MYSYVPAVDMIDALNSILPSLSVVPYKTSISYILFNFGWINLKSIPDNFVSESLKSDTSNLNLNFCNSIGTFNITFLLPFESFIVTLSVSIYDTTNFPPSFVY